MKRIVSILVAFWAVGASTVALAEPPWEPVDAILCRGASGEGFSYSWGGECWNANGCSPDYSQGVGFCDDCGDGNGCSACPGGCCYNGVSCLHTGTWGADCSGFVSKAWQVWDPHPLNDCSITNRPTASSFTQPHAYWNAVPMNALQPADAVATSAHVILIYGYEDAAGNHEVVEAKGCNYGIVRQIRSFSGFVGARRINLEQCVCADGDQETEPCGDCGARTRSCQADCLWSPWSDCDGPDPSGEDATCTVSDAVGVCAVGQRLCVAGWLSCQGGSPSTEVCDGLDNDCDGEVDNGTPENLGEGYPCENACGQGVSQCLEGGVRCVTPGTTWPDETCDATPPDDNHGSVRGGCNCRTGAGTPALPVVAVLLFLLLLGCRRRRGN